MAPRRVNSNEANNKVYVAKSKIQNGGKGLFAKVLIPKGEVICTYSGKLIDCTDAKYVDPTYIVSFNPGKGFRLIGDNETGDMGHFANSIHPENKDVKQNGRFNLSLKKMLPNQRGQFPLIACENIKKNEEIIVNYGDGYWLKMNKWTNEEHPTRSASTLAREERALRRSQKPDEILREENVMTL